MGQRGIEVNLLAFYYPSLRTLCPHFRQPALKTCDPPHLALEKSVEEAGQMTSITSVSY